MKLFRFEYETNLDFSCSVTGHSFTLRCIPFSDGRQEITEPVYSISPKTENIWHSRDSFGNILICGAIDEPHEEFSFKVSGEAKIINSCSAAGRAEAFYGFHTPLTRPGEKILEFYNGSKPSSDDVISRTEELSEKLFNYMTYQKGVTGTETTAEEAFELGQGVCQDYAHILLSLLRLDRIRCRYISGLAFQCGETHAWVEVHDGEHWVGIDPTHNRLIGDRYIKLCHGRDYSDCPIERGIYLGSAQSIQTVSSLITEI